MTQFKKLELQLDHKFDASRCRHFIDGELTVFHCHHFSTLYTQLALDTEFLNGKALLTDCAEDTFHPILRKYFSSHGATELADRLSIGSQYFGALGLGKMNVLCAGPDAGEVVLDHSHVDEGWVKKWGKSQHPVNYLSAGFVAALFSAAHDLPPRSYSVTETSSIAMGAKDCRFTVVRS